jgi:hypothetical protein
MDKDFEADEAAHEKRQTTTNVNRVGRRINRLNTQI